jgi:hypothetical protein
MPQLPNDKEERFAHGLASGMSAPKAYVAAGWAASRSRPAILARRPHIVERVRELIQGSAEKLAKGVARIAIPRPMQGAVVIDRMEATRDAVAREMALLAFSNMDDYVTHIDGVLVVDFSRATRDQMAPIKEITVETYVEGRGDKAQTVSRVRLKLYDKSSALLNFARLMGYAAEPPDPTIMKIEERLRRMTPEERKEDARQLWERAQEVLRRTEERETRRRASDAEFEDIHPSRPTG